MIAILMALPEESQGFIEQTVARHPNARVFFTGIGLLAATYKATEIISQHQPQRIINLGTAGSRHLPVGSVVEVNCVKNRSSRLPAYLDEWIKIPSHNSFPQVVCGSADHIDENFQSDQFDIVDMEAYAIAYVCKQKGVPLNIVKYVSDQSDSNAKNAWREQLPQAAQKLNHVLMDFLSQPGP